MRGRCVIASHDQSPFLVHGGLPDLAKPRRCGNTCEAKIFVSISWPLSTASASLASAKPHTRTRCAQAARKCRLRGTGRGAMG